MGFAGGLATNGTSGSGGGQTVTQFPFPMTVDPAAAQVSGGTTVPTGSFLATYQRVTVGSAAITKIKFVVTVQSGNMAVALFRDSGGNAPGALVVASGSFAVPVAGIGSFTVASQTVNPGDWFALVADNTTAKFAAAAIGGGAINNPTWREVAQNLASLTFASNPGGLVSDSRVFAIWGE